MRARSDVRYPSDRTSYLDTRTGDNPRDREREGIRTMPLAVRVRAADLADAAAIAQVHVDSWRTTYRGIVPDAFLAGLPSERRTEAWTGILRDSSAQSCVYVAADSQGTVVGFASGGPERAGDALHTGEVYALYPLASSSAAASAGHSSWPPQPVSPRRAGAPCWFGSRPPIQPAGSMRPWVIGGWARGRKRLAASCSTRSRTVGRTQTCA